jgi:hypothetical protein
MLAFAFVVLLCMAMSPVAWSQSRASPVAPQMPDLSHQLLAEHAARSHGLDGQRLAWVAQGAYDEDHCRFEPYPPCSWWIPNGHHSWDPDTGQFWTEPAIWGDFGSGLVHADWLFRQALAAEAMGQEQAAYLYLGRAIHMLGDMATPAHVHLDTHLPPFDSDPYEVWLNAGDLANTRAWLQDHPPEPSWDLAYDGLPTWDELSPDLQGQLDGASSHYGNRTSGQDLWRLGPEGQDVVVFRLLFLMAEEADNYDSDDAAGEQVPGDLDNPEYLVAMRDTLFPRLVQLSAALIDTFEHRTGSCPGCRAYLPLVSHGP